MEYLIVAGILLMVVAPIIAVLPSPNQKRKMVLRRAAMNLGITVEITKIDDPHPFQEKYLTNLGLFLVFLTSMDICLFESIGT